MTQSELKQQITSGRLSGTYLFCGEEEYLKRYYRDAIRKAIITDPAFDSMDHVVFDSDDVAVAEVSEAVKGMPLFCAKRLVEWNHAPLDAMKQSARDALLAVCREAAEPDSMAVLVLCADETGFDPGTQKKPSEGMKLFSDAAQVVRFDRSTDAQLLGWIARHFAHENLKADAAVCRRMTDRCGHAMEDLAHEIDKVACFVHAAGRDTVTTEDVDNVCCVNRENDAFGLTNALLDGRPADAFACLDELKSRRADPQLIMGQLSRFYCDLLGVALLLSEGKNAGSVASLLKMNEYKAGLYVRAAKRLGLSAIRACFAACRETDLYMKSVYAEPYGQIANLLTRVAR